MPADNFVVCQWTFANILNPDEDQQQVGLDLDPNCLTLMVVLGGLFVKI